MFGRIILKFIRNYELFRKRDERLFKFEVLTENDWTQKKSQTNRIKERYLKEAKWYETNAVEIYQTAYNKNPSKSYKVIGCSRTFS